MKFMVDAQLPRRLSNWFRDQGYDAQHTLDLPEGNCTQDAEVVGFEAATAGFLMGTPSS